MNNTNNQNCIFFFNNLVSDQIDTWKDSYFVKQKKTYDLSNKSLFEKYRTNKMKEDLLDLIELVLFQ